MKINNAIITLGMVKSGHVNIWRNAPPKHIFVIWIVSPDRHGHVAAAEGDYVLGLRGGQSYQAEG